MRLILLEARTRKKSIGRNPNSTVCNCVQSDHSDILEPPPHISCQKLCKWRNVAILWILWINSRIASVRLAPAPEAFKARSKGWDWSMGSIQDPCYVGLPYKLKRLLAGWWVEQKPLRWNVWFGLMSMQCSLLWPFWGASFIKGRVKQACFNMYVGYIHAQRRCARFLVEFN